MTSPESIWRGETESKRKIVRSLWPDLAAALDGSATDATPPPMCWFCAARVSRGTCDEKPICGTCVGRLDPAVRHEIVRHGRG